jgi:serine/threonine protein phosphatase PrpC
VAERTRPQNASLEIAERTDPGRDPEKQVNEDALACAETPLGTLAIVCDGMGGHAGGKEASELAVRTILEVMGAATPKTPARDALRVALEEANRRVWSMPTAEAGYRPGSTVVAVLVHELGAEVAHVGDSRVYLLHAGAVSQVTRDHSMVQEMVDRKLIRAEDAASHPDANKILRALGIAKEAEVEVRPEPLRYVAGDVMVLCSDGLSDLVGPAEILEIAGSQPPAQAAGQLVDLANARGGHDNITALVVRFKATSNNDGAATIVKTVAVTAHDALPLTQDDASRGSSAPQATLLAPPLGLPGTAPLAAPLPAPAPATSGPSLGSSPNVIAPGVPAVPPAPRAQGAPGSARSPLTVLGVLLAIAAIAVLGALYIVLERKPRHVPVPPASLDAGAPVLAPLALPEVPEVPVSPAPSAAPDADAATPLAAPLPTAVPPLEAPSGPSDLAPSPLPPSVSPPPSPTPVMPRPTVAPLPTREPPVCVQLRALRANPNTREAVLKAFEAKCRAAGGTP